MATGQEMCELIVEADIIRKPDGSKFTPEEIWNYSPTGELYRVYTWYEVARKKLGMKASYAREKLPDPSDTPCPCHRGDLAEVDGITYVYWGKWVKLSEWNDLLIKLEAKPPLPPLVTKP